MKMKNSNIPEDIKFSLDLYRDEGYHPGSFLEAVLCNDLIQAVKCCAHNDLAWIAVYIINNFPAEAYGSKEKVLTWREKQRTVRESQKVG